MLCCRLSIQALASAHAKLTFVIYSRNDPTEEVKARILNTAADTFNIPTLKDPELMGRIVFVKLSTVKLLEARLYPRFTLIGQSVGSMVVATEAVLRERCDIYFDSTGFAFTYPVVYLLSILFCSREELKRFRIMCYTHYPTISTDMLEKVSRREADYNNDERYAKSSVLAALKLHYYKVFAMLYSSAGKHLVMIQALLTHSHFLSLCSDDSHCCCCSS